MIYFSSETVPNECGGSNSKGGLIDNRIGIVRIQSACRMTIYGGRWLPKVINGRRDSTRNRQFPITAIDTPDATG
jgi:hypothetical protein